MKRERKGEAKVVHVLGRGGRGPIRNKPPRISSMRLRCDARRAVAQTCGTIMVITRMGSQGNAEVAILQDAMLRLHRSSAGGVQPLCSLV